MEHGTSVFLPIKILSFFLLNFYYCLWLIQCSLKFVLDEIKEIIRNASHEIGENGANTSIDSNEEDDEFTLAQNIEKQLVCLNKPKDIARFRHLHRKLCHSKVIIFCY